jgi:hypothetical protein
MLEIPDPKQGKCNFSITILQQEKTESARLSAGRLHPGRRNNRL